MKVIEVTPTISTLIYAAGDAVGGLLEFPFAGGSDGQGGRIVGAAVVDEGDQAAALKLALFDVTFTATADQAAFDPSDDDMRNCIGIIDFAAADYAGGVNNQIATKSNLGMPYVPVGTSLFGQLFTSGTPTYPATNDLTVKLFVEES